MMRTRHIVLMYGEPELKDDLNGSRDHFVQLSKVLNTFLS